MTSHPPFKDLLKSIPGFFGIRLEEEPAFDVVAHVGDVEVRHYKQALLAEVTVGGEHDEAMNVAFRKLAGYIFGDNASGTKSEMTTPVVQAVAQGPGANTPVIRAAENGTWTVSFFLSNTLSATEAPRPDDPAIRLVDHPASTIASLRYTGNNTDESRADSKARLLAAIKGSPQWRAVDDVAWALYDQPFSIPFLKRNEAHVEVEQVAP